ncbi:MAG: periplasmic heavy metal sensor [Rhodobacteraceae bacterium]|nr:periplasmic heavy metal sensor [Paracoccaceae bacterium]
MTETDGKNPNATGRWKTWALVASLALNLFVAAVVAGAVLRHPRPPHDGEVRDIGFGPYTAALSSEDRTALRDAFLAAAPDFREKRREMRADVTRLAASLRSEPWDAAATEAILARQGADLASRLDLGRRLFIERLSAMTPEARRALAERIEKAATRGFHDGRGPGN